MNKFYMNGKLIHKASDHNTKRCEVEKWVFLPHSDFERLKANPYQEHEAITAARDLMYEDKNALENTHARLLILDPFQSFLIQDGDLHSVGRMRTTLGNLAVIASRYRCAVVLIGHMNKSATGKSLYRGLGSIDIAAIARSVLMVTRDEDDPEIRYMIPIKASLAPEGAEIAFRMNRDIGFQWLKNKNKNTKKRLKKSDVAEILVNMLEYGELTSGVILQKIQELGASERTLYTLKKELGIKSFRRKGIWYWRLPDIEDNNK